MDRDQTGFKHSLFLVQAEYLEMPGLQLTKPQVGRLWSLDADVADVLLNVLVSARFLRRTRHGAYKLAGAVRSH
jgi:hypothetical protein